MAVNKRDAQIGRNVAGHRRGKSQQAVADAMRARGWRWAQATVWSVEKGERPLRLAEATDLADILEVGLDDLIEGGIDGLVAHAVVTARHARERAIESWLEFHRATAHLADVLRVAEEEVPGITEAAFGDEIEQLSPKATAEEMKRRQGHEGWI